MPIFPQKKKTLEVTYIQENIIVVRGEKWHRHDHELQEIRNGLAIIIKQNNKILKAIGDSAADAGLRQQILDTLNKSIVDIKSTV